jgi:BlaI family penicillinase repressor
MPKTPRTRLSEAQWRLMRALWTASAPAGQATAREVLEALEPGTPWAYTTTKTMLDRLAQKGTVERRSKGGLLHYRPLVTQEAAQRRAADALRGGAFGGQAAPLVHYLFQSERLTAKDRQELRRLLRKAGLDGESGEP